MQSGLPAGWRVTNSEGSWSAPSRDDDEDDNIALDSGLEPEDLRPDSPGWEDVEPEEEEGGGAKIKSFFDDVYAATYEEWSGREMEVHSFDFGAVCSEHRMSSFFSPPWTSLLVTLGEVWMQGADGFLELDFYGAVRLINYIRSLVAAGDAARPDTSDKALWQDEKFMKPVLEDDALISSLYDVEGLLAPEEDEAEAAEAVEGAPAAEGDGHREVARMALG
ncbi:arginine N-methyltransferase 3 [Teratosphaeria destructans]|uniref:type I protein arginine methyltransferase n=1 Tax=Teratosphaeria destructans TaxID=418781 RepID=A0A9W7SNN2_9PEZI|nr:arginine N-methyltransferase 3 [Teratosphaeria destructans]